MVGGLATMTAMLHWNGQQRTDLVRRNREWTWRTCSIQQNWDSLI